MLPRYSDMIRIVMISIALFMTVITSVRASDGRDSAVWWVKTYGGLLAKDEPLVGRAEEVFDKVAAAADKNTKRFPRLVVINYAYEPYAVSIQDGSIILTLGGLKLCYRGVSQARGDARLAFVLGHELAHSAKDDYWHAAAFAAVKEYKGSGVNERKSLLKYLQNSAGQGDGEKGKEVTKIRELQADSYGLLFMAMAGYDPKVIIDQDGTNFFREWITQITGSPSFEGPSHPDSQERAEFFRTQLATVAGEVDLFSFGVRLFQIGNYEDALLLLDKFREKFPSREVFGNIGLAHFQLAMKELAVCDQLAPFRFKLSTIVDVKTLAPKSTTRGTSNVCRDAENHRRSLANAIKHLEMAAAKDQQHFPTLVNLASAYIFAGEYARAMAVADTALKLSPDNPLAINGKAVALFLFGRSGGLDSADAALAMLREAATRNPEITDSLYNQAAIAAERERDAAAKDAWKAFLAKEPEGAFARSAMKRLGRTVETAQPLLLNDNLKPPIKLGEINGETALFLKTVAKHSFSIGRTDIDIYDGKGMRSLAINGSIEVVETVLDSPLSFAEFKREYGEPLRIVTTTVGSTHVYRNIAVDVQDGSVKSMVFFEGKGR
ncbi:MAG: M48 family metalloprotease [Desulfuromonadaceae bacterium]